MPATPGAESRRNELIQSIYRISLEPLAYDDFMGHWDAFISERLTQLQDLRDSQDADDVPEIKAHFDIAAQLLEQAVRDGSDSGSNVERDPQFLVDTTGRIVWTNASAARGFGIRPGKPVADLEMRTRDRDLLQAAIDALSDQVVPDSSTPTVFQLPRPGAPSGSIHLQAAPLEEASGEALLLVTALSHSWPKGMAKLLRSNFGLSVSECEIAERLTQAKSPATIAEERASSVATVRTQIKSLLAKAGCTSQLELVKLIFILTPIAERDASASAFHTEADHFELTLSSGRRICLEQHGPATGRAVYFIHGMLDGIALPQAFRDALVDANLRVICPMRPWFGKSAPDTDPVEGAPDRFARDSHEILTRLGVESAVAVGHMSGSVYSFAAASFSDRISGIVNVSGGVPIKSLSQFATMSTRQRLMAYTARFTPKLLPFVIQAGIGQLNEGEHMRLIKQLYASAPIDQNACDDPEVRAIVIDGYDFIISQGHMAFQVDCHQVVQDWGRYVAGSNVPVTLVHGRHDPVVSAQSIEDFGARHRGRVTLQIYDDAGQLIFYRHPERVLAALTEMHDALSQD